MTLRRRSIIVASCIIASATVSGCAGMSTGSNTPVGPASQSPISAMSGIGTTSATAQPRDLSNVKSWSIHSSKVGSSLLTVDQLAAEAVDLTIVTPGDLKATDKSTSGSVPAPNLPAAASTASVLSRLVGQVRGISGKKVLALVDGSSIDIHSAQWDARWADAAGKLTGSAPGWLDQPILPAGAPKGTPASAYSVRFWDADWEKVLKSAVAEDRRDGFDGVCLFGLDAYRSSLGEHPAAAQDMERLISDTAGDVRKSASNFLIVVVDNDGMISKLTDKQRADYSGAIDAVVAQGVFYGGSKPVDNDLNPNVEDITSLDQYRTLNKPVFVADYLNAADKIADFEARARTRSYLGYPISVKSTVAPEPEGKAAVLPASAVTSGSATIATPGG